MKYYAYITQKYEGCDYSIHCGSELLELNAQSQDDALLEIKGMIEESFRPGEDYELEECILLEVNNVNNVNIKAINDEILTEEEQKKKAKKAKKERDEYERLKKKYG